MCEEAFRAHNIFSSEILDYVYVNRNIIHGLFAK